MELGIMVIIKIYLIEEMLEYSPGKYEEILFCHLTENK
jgi:hypothetical protein